MTDVLNIWLRGEHLGTVQQLRTGRTRLRFSDAAVQRWGVGTRLLSYSLPMTNRRLDSEDVANFLDNLLPEGAVRAQFEQRYRLRPGDAFGLLARIGVECAGAVQLTVDEVPPDGRLVPLTDAEATRIVTELPTLSAPEGGTLSASLGGVQSKVLLTRTDEGWQRGRPREELLADPARRSLRTGTGLRRCAGLLRRLAVRRFRDATGRPAEPALPQRHAPAR